MWEQCDVNLFICKPRISFNSGSPATKVGFETASIAKQVKLIYYSCSEIDREYYMKLENVEKIEVAGDGTMGFGIALNFALWVQ